MGVFFSKSCVYPPSSIDSLSDDEVYALIEKTEKTRKTCLNFSPDEEDADFLTPTTWKITSDAIVKRVCSLTPHEAVLPVRDAITETWWLVMDFIEGHTLHALWPTMSWWSRLCTVWTLRGYIRQLYHLPLPYPDKPGPFDGTDKALKCRGVYFTEYGAGPFNSYRDMAAWYDHKRYSLQVYHHQCYNIFWRCPRFDSSHPLVLCHNDLHMKNIIIDRYKKTWLLDWGYAGAAPPWFEYAHIAAWETAAAPASRPPKSWQFFFRFITGNYRSYFTQYLERLVPMIDSLPAVEHEAGYFDDLGLDPNSF